MFSDGDSIAVIIIWTFFAIYVFYGIVFNYIIFPEKAKAVFGKDCNPSHPETIRHKYLISIFLDDWTSNFDLKKTIIFFELITSSQTKMVSFSVTGDDIINKRVYLLLHRKKVLRPLTRIRMIHDCPLSDARIRLSAIKVHDMKYGSTFYYSFHANIYYGAMRWATVHNTSALTISPCSETILAPYFVQTRTDTFSLQRIITYIGKNCETKGAILMAEINGWEDMMFNLFMAISEVYFDVLFAVKLNHFITKWPKVWVLFLSAVLSSGISFNSTNISALFYRKFIKTNYNIHCSPQLIERDEDSLLWTLYKNLSLTTLVAISILVSIFIPYFIETNTSADTYLAQLFGIKWLDNNLFNETAFLIAFWVFTHILSITLWLLISAIIKYLYLSVCGQPIYIPYESLVKEEDEMRAADDDSYRKTPQKDRDPSKLQLGTERLETELKSDQQNKKLRTGSVILSSAKKPLGFVDPEKRCGDKSDTNTKTNTTNETKN